MTWGTKDSGMLAHLGAGSPGDRPRFLTASDCQDIARRLARYAMGGGETDVHVQSVWRGNVRWARNEIISSGEDRDNRVDIKRRIRGAETYNSISLNDVRTAALVAAERRAERMVGMDEERVESDIMSIPGSPVRYVSEPVDVPSLFFDSTYQLNAAQRVAAAQQMIQSARAAGMLSAGYIEVSATSLAYLTSWGYTQYFQYTWARCSVTVREPRGTGSGWAGVDWPDWSKIDGAQLAATALEKCLKSRNPVAVEPGRYTTILEPQAVCDFIGQWLGGFTPGPGPRYGAEVLAGFQHKKGTGIKEPPFPVATSDVARQVGYARFGEKVIDERLSIRQDPMDPELGFPPYDRQRFNVGGERVFHPVTWIERGVLRHLVESMDYAAERLGRPTSLESSGAFRMSVDGPTATLAEMIAATKRGLLVTRFDQAFAFGESMEVRGYTRDGLWLIENGAVSKPVTNMVFVESVWTALNNVEQVGAPQRIFRPVPGGALAWMMNPQPAVVPALKIKDFSFTALSRAI